MNDEIKKYEKLLNEIDDEIDDIVENFKYLLDHQYIADINILSFYAEINNLLNKKNYVENRIFNLKN